MRAPGGRFTAWRELLDAMQGHRVAVIGDPVLDVYLYGSTHRISREAPVLVVREDARELRLGGGANTAANLAALGARCTLVGLVGADADGDALVALAGRAGIEVGALVRRTAGCTVTKTRVLAGGQNTRKQQMLRIDRENDGPPTAEEASRLLAAATAALEDVSAVVVSDYGDPSLTRTYVEIARLARARGKVVVVDSRYAVTAFAGVTAITPNEPEVEAALGTSLPDAGAALAAADRLTRTLGLEATLLTRGREGMVVAAREAPPELLPAHGGHEAVDVTGAGDTVTATFTLALTAGARILDAAVLANCAAGEVVKAVGTATCGPAALLEALLGGGR